MPSHPELVTIQHGEGLTSALVAVNDMEAGFKVPLSGLTHGEKRYTTVQCSETEHFELNSDFVYMNHSCEPSCELIVDEGTYVRTRQPIKAGEALTFFYPSTEVSLPYRTTDQANKTSGTWNNHSNAHVMLPRA